MASKNQFLSLYRIKMVIITITLTTIILIIKIIIWKCTVKELFSVNPRKNISERACFHHSCKRATILKMCCVAYVFLGTCPKLTEQLFQCMRQKTQWHTHSVVFFYPSILVVTKGYTYLNKPASLSCGGDWWVGLLKYV